MQSMSEAEKEIMQIIWNNGNSIFIGKLLEAVEARGFGWERATVRTFVARLIEKGYVKAQKQGKAAEYFAVLTEEEYLTVQAKRFVNGVFNGNVRGLLTSLFGQDSLDKDTMESLEEFWESVKEESQ